MQHAVQHAQWREQFPRQVILYKDVGTITISGHQSSKRKGCQVLSGALINMLHNLHFNLRSENVYLPQPRVYQSVLH